jgi:hypothetical protein
MARRSLIVELVGDDASLQRAFGRTSRGATKMEKDVTRAGRGLLSGSGAARSFGRSLAFASGGFLAFSGASAFLRTSIDAAKEAQVAQKQLAQQLHNSGKSYADYREQITSTVDSLSALAGIQNDELLGGLTTILRTTPDVNKALRDLATAADLARAKHISLGAAATVIAKTEAGNTTLLRRQGFQIAKNATAEQALATLRRVVAGQARAGTTDQERFGAVLHRTEEEIGLGLLPTLNVYLRRGTRWLQQMNEQKRLQGDVAHAAHDFASAVGFIAGAVQTVDRVTGSFSNTLKILLAYKAAKWAFELLGPLARLGPAFGGAEAGAVGLTGALAGNAGLYGAALLAGYGLGTLGIHLVGLQGFLTDTGSKAYDLAQNLGLIGENADKANAQVKTLGAGNPLLGLTGKAPTVESLDALRKRFSNLTQHQFEIFAAQAINIANRPTDSVIASDARDRRNQGPVLSPSTGKKLTAEQRNTFFDNDIARILFRGGLGNLQSQLAAMEKASALLTKRIAVTKDITRKRKLEDQLLQVQADERTTRAQQAANQTQARADARAKAEQDAQTRHDQRQKRLFAMLGLGPTGEARVPGVAGLRTRLGQLRKNIAGTFLDTAKTDAQLDRIGKVLLDKFLPGQPQVRAAIASLFDTLSGQLQSTSKLPKFAHANTDAILRGLGLDAETTRKLRQRLSQLGPGGTVPAGTSAAFAGAGAIVVHSHTYLDGQQIATTVTKAQQKARTRRADSRRGPYAGPH